MENKNKTLVIVLIAIIAVVVIAVVGFIGYKALQKPKDENAKQKVEDKPTVQLGGSSKKPESKAGNTSLQALEVEGKTKQKRYMENYEIIGTIEIPKTGLKANILDETTKRALEIAITKIYTTGGINNPGNTVLYGHNYRNSLLFSKNDELQTGDKVYITDEEGRKITYEIFNKFETTSSDTTFYTRNSEATGGKAEVTLSTCTDDASQTDRRLILQAREM